MRFFRLLCLLLILTGSIFPSLAQNKDYWDDTCQPGIRYTVAEAIQSTMDEVTHQAACTVYQACQNDGSHCNIVLYQHFLDQCHTVDAACDTQSILQMAAILRPSQDAQAAGNIGLLMMPVSQYGNEVSDSLPAALFYGYREGIDAHYEREGRGLDDNLDIAVGALYEYRSDFEKALDAYTKAVPNPLAHYRRGFLYEKMGHSDLASLDVLQLKLLAGDGTEFDTLIAHFASDELILEEWLSYQQSIEVIPGHEDNEADDFAYAPATPRQIQLARLENNEKVVLITSYSQAVRTTLADGTISTIYQPAYDIQTYHHVDDAPSIEYHSTFYLQGDNNRYFYEDEYRLNMIEFHGDVAYLYSSVICECDAGMTISILAPVNAPDPRPEYPQCGAGPRQWLRVGHIGVTWQPRLHNGPPERFHSHPLLYEQPGGQPVAHPEYSVLVVDGPICLGDVSWWAIKELSSQGEVSDDVYWTPETIVTNSRNPHVQYQINARGYWYDFEHQCSQNRKIGGVGSRGYVRPDVSPIDVFVERHPDSNHLATMRPEDMFTIVDGALCDEYGRWYQVEYAGIVGWVM
ncbi:MAG: hypothetical protein ACPG7F_07080, partial [Aggregatilineales bacterium]